MEAIAPDVYLLDGFPKYAINVYLIGNIVIDAGARFQSKSILQQLADRPLIAHILTHPHPDHQGASKAICERFNIPLWCGADDADAMNSGNWDSLIPNPTPLTRAQSRMMAGPKYPITRELREGDQIGDFIVIETPGHTPGHVAYWREQDRLLILGDVLFNQHPLTAKVGLSEPITFFTCDPTRNRQSARKLAALQPAVICFGHGPPLYDGDAFQSFIANIPDK